MSQQDSESYSIKNEELLYERDRIAFKRIIHKLPNGLTAEKGIVEYPAAVAGLPVLSNGSFLLVSQFRFGAGKKLWEIPAGKLDPKEDPETGLLREMAEEIGYQPKKWERIATYYPAPGILSEIMYLYLASDLEPHPLPPDDDEFIEVKEFSLNKIRQMISEGDIQDAKTLIAFFWYMQKMSF